MIKLSQKRTCEGCKAMYQSKYIDKCELGYGFSDKFVPMEPCPKPKTYIQLIECKRLYVKITQPIPYSESTLKDGRYEIF